MRHQKMMTWVSISGTALSVFLVMAFFMTDGIKSAEVAPASNRHCILTGKSLSVEIDGNPMVLSPDFPAILPTTFIPDSTEWKGFHT